ncbi:MAG: hypothetical protein LBM12_03325 [Candidatus Nomurabacteria bacterium]|jgi:primosomal protein N'|nr:hypothetical protein [Candidatus Nomurabacteria bacterium]
MPYYEVAPNKVFRAGESVLTYSSEQKLAIGTLVEIPLGKQKALGVVIRKVEPPKFKTKEVLKVCFQNSLPPHLLQAANFLHQYYATEMPVVWQTILPNGIGGKK